MKVEQLIAGENYTVSYMPTNWLYKRTGVFKKQTETSLIFDIPNSDKEFFSFDKRYLIDVQPCAN